MRPDETIRGKREGGARPARRHAAEIGTVFLLALLVVFLFFTGSFGIAGNRGGTGVLLGVGVLVGLGFVWREILGLRRQLAVSEARRRAALICAGDGAWEWDLTTGRMVFSESWRAMLGLVDGATVDSPETWRRLLHPDDAERWHVELERHLRGDAPIYLSEHRLRGKDGTYAWFQARGRVIARTPEGRALSMMGTHSDIARQKQTEARLRDNDSIFAQFLEHSPIYVFIKDEAIRSIRLSRNYERLLGRPLDAILGKTMDALFPPELAAAMIADDSRILAEGRALTVEEELDGHFYETLKFPIVLDGRPRYLAGFTIDITERKRAETALRESEARFAKAFRASPAAMSISRIADGFNVDVNDEWETLTGYARAEALGKTAAELGCWPEPGQRDVFVALLTRDGHFRDVEATLRTKTGERREVVLAGETIEIGGEPHLLLAFHDITARKRAERDLIAQRELLDTIIETIPHGIFWKDRDGVYIACNTVAARNWGFERREDITGKTVFELARDPAEAEALTAMDRLVIDEGRAQINFEDSHVEADGSVATHLSSKLPLRDATGAVTGLVCVFLDVTEQRRAEERLRHAQKMEVVGQLAGGTAHDFNNLLQVIQANLELIALGDDGDDAASRPLVDAALDAVRRGARLSQQLLSFSRQQALRPEAVDANALIGRAAGLLGRLLGEDIAIETRFDPAIGPVFVDPGGLENALLNLALNARAAMPDGGRLEIASAPRRLAESLATEEGQLAPGDYVEITVADSGCGMAAPVLARAFEPFFTTKEVGKGSGLGLSMVYGFALQSGGHAALESEPGRGTTARLLFPAMAARPMGLAEPPARPPLAAGSGTVLVVEDAADVRASVVLLLRALGYDTREAASGNAALAILAADAAVDLLFADVVMPGGMSGLELADEAVRRHPDLKVLLTSGYPEGALAAADPAGGRFRLLGKPYSTADLGEALGAALG